MATTRDWYLGFASFEAAGSSATYETLARAVADSDAVLSQLDELPTIKRQPNLLFAAARACGVPIDDPGRFLDGVTAEWVRIADVMSTHATQTNEAARTGTFLPMLAEIEGPIALIEVGCSAGLCLYPDRYAISYDGRPALAAGSSVPIAVATSGRVPVPTRLPDVVTRIGVDLSPIDVADAAARAWLEVLVWPEHHERLVRLRAAMDLVAADPPILMQGDLIATIDTALAAVPAGATPVVFHSAVLNYISSDQRLRFAERIAAHPDVVWLSNEGPGVLADVATDLVVPPDAGSEAHFLLVRGGTEVIGISDPHGSWIAWA